MSFTNVTSINATRITNGTITPKGYIQIANLPDFCRVIGNISPVNDSNIGFELWLPVAAWNNKYMQIGNGGLAGTLALTYATSPEMLRRGYAVAGTDDGHITAPGQDPGAFAVGHPAKLQDLADRAPHVTSIVAKEILRKFYGSTEKYAYFQGCSAGGKEAYTEAQRYPEDFDGIIAGAPAAVFTETIIRFIWVQQALQHVSNSTRFLSKLTAIEKAVFDECDGADGLVDGIISDPSTCYFDPMVLQCAGQENDQCLTSEQVVALRKIYSPVRNSRTGVYVTSGYEPGGENAAGAGTWRDYIWGNGKNGSAAQITFANSFGRNFVYEGRNWTLESFDFDSDLALWRAKIDPFGYDARSVDLSGFRNRGSKMIQYQGWLDASVAPRVTVDRYKQTMVQDASFTTQDYFRLFMVPGMNHCATGPGPNSFGQPYNATAPPPSKDSDHDIVTALERWVEAGLKPDKLIATKYAGDVATGNITMQRPLCPYPENAVYVGGDMTKAGSFRCR